MKKRVRKRDSILRLNELETLMESGTIQKINVRLFEEGFQIMIQADGEVSVLGMSRGPLPRTFKQLKTVEKWLAARGCPRDEKDAAQWSANRADAEVRRLKAEYDRFMAESDDEDLKERMRDVAAGISAPYDPEEVERQCELARTATNGLLREVQEKAKRRVRARWKAA